jgi:hypothetical protein
MRDDIKQNVAGRSCGPQAYAALDRIIDVVLDGLRHGHFRCTISSAIVKNNKRDFVIEAGKSHKFTIPEDDLPG